MSKSNKIRKHNKVADNQKRATFEYYWRSLFEEKSQLIATFLSSMLLLTFIYALFSDSSFLWAMYEERDFMRAVDIANFRYFPTLGPELLQGGQTPGGFLYVFLAFFIKLSSSPIVFAILNKLLFVLSAILIWIIIKTYVNNIAATLGLLFFCTSSVIAEFAFWPIHPSMSIFFYLLFVFLVLKGFIDSSSISILLAGLVLSLLVQFHFSYYMLVFTYLIIIVSMRKYSRVKMSTYMFSLALFILPLVPYLFEEIIKGFPNFKLIISRPRFQHGYVNVWAIGESPIMDLLIKWIQTDVIAAGEIINFLRVVIFLLSSVLVISVISGLIKTADKNKLFVKLISIFFIVPLAVLFFSKMGHNHRHIISFAPLIFILVATGLSYLIKHDKTLKVMVLGFITISILIYLPSAKKTSLIAFNKSEWAVDYNYRSNILTSLASNLGITDGQYKSKIYWWWIGYAADPYAYNKIDKKIENKEFAKILELDKPDTFLLILQHKYSDHIMNPVLFHHVFDMAPIAKINDVQSIWKAKLKQFKGAYPMGNSINRTQLELIEQKIEYLNVKEDGLFRINFNKNEEDARKKVYLLSLQKGRIKVLIKLHFDDKTHSVGWEMISPHLNGYYQEIKTIWKPYIKITDKVSGKTKTLNLLDDVVGSFIYKTPLKGSIDMPDKVKLDEISIGVKGWFDQSSMKSPEIKDVYWNISEAEKNKVQIGIPSS